MAYVKDDEDEFVRRVMQNKLAAQAAEQEQAKRQLEKQMRRINELDTIIQRLYEDHVTGKLTAERFPSYPGDMSRNSLACKVR